MNLPVLALKAYQKTVAPVLPVLLGGGCGCRFAPTCSQYAIEALETHGLVTGSYLAVRRVLKCQPFHPGGVDVVPELADRRERSRRFVPVRGTMTNRWERPAESFDPVELGAKSSILDKPLNTCG